MTHLRLYETPNLGVHQTGSSSNIYNESGDLGGSVGTDAEAFVRTQAELARRLALHDLPAAD
jgi:hypothetical protein